MGAPPGLGTGRGARRSRRALLAASVATGTAGCAVPWQRTDPRARIFTPPAQTPVRFGPTRLRLVLSQEGRAPLDAAVRDAVVQAAAAERYTLDLSDIEQFAGSNSANDVIRQLLVSVQVGLPPDGVLLLGRRAQTARMQTMGLIQEVSGLMRSARGRWGAAPEVAERAHLIRGNWFAAPLYQRLVGHFVRADGFTRAGIDAEAGTASWQELREAVTRTGGWGVGPADSPDADAWCWSAIHGWGGVLADKGGARVMLASPETAAAIEWLVGAFRDTSWPDGPDGAKDASFGAGDRAYTYTEGSAGVTSGGVLVSGPAGPAFRPRAAGGGAVWVLPRGARAAEVERLWDALWQQEWQRRVWTAGAGFALPVFEGQWSDSTLTALPNQESLRRFRGLLATGGFVSDTGQAGLPTAASQAVEAGRLATRMVRAALSGRAVSDVLAAARADAEAIYREHAFPEG